MNTPDTEAPDTAAAVDELQTQLDGGMITVALLKRVVAAYRATEQREKATAEREQRRLEGLKARKVPDDQKAAELKLVASKWSYVSANGRSNSAVLALLAKAFPNIPENRLRTYAIELRRARRKEQEARREAVRRRIARTTAQHKARIEAERERGRIESTPTAIANYLKGREFETAEN